MLRTVPTCLFHLASPASFSAFVCVFNRSLCLQFGSPGSHRGQRTSPHVQSFHTPHGVWPVYTCTSPHPWIIDSSGDYGHFSYLCHRISFPKPIPTAVSLPSMAGNINCPLLRRFPPLFAFSGARSSEHHAIPSTRRRAYMRVWAERM